MIIEDKKVVSMHYTLKNDAGEVIDSSSGGEPLAYIQGLGNIIPGLEKELLGKKVGDKVEATIPPAEAYGVKNPELVQAVPLTSFPEKDQVKVGAQFQVTSPEGARIATITKVENEEATIDLNHPLADQTLHFAVEIMSIRDAEEDEIAHGHVHGPGGQQH